MAKALKYGFVYNMMVFVWKINLQSVLNDRYTLTLTNDKSINVLHNLSPLFRILLAKYSILCYNP